MRMLYKITRGDAVSIFEQLQRAAHPKSVLYSPAAITELRELLNDCRVLPFSMLPDAIYPHLLMYLIENNYYDQYCIITELFHDA